MRIHPGEPGRYSADMSSGVYPSYFGCSATKLTPLLTTSYKCGEKVSQVPED